MPQAQGQSRAKKAAAAAALAAPPATSAAAGFAGTAAGVQGARKIIQSTLAAVLRVLRGMWIRRQRIILRDAAAKGFPLDDVTAAINAEADREKVYRRRAAARTKAGLSAALKAPDASARAAGVEATIRREQRFARQRSEATAERVFAAVERLSVRRLSPQGAFWTLGPTSDHTPDCLAMAGRFWPWSVLDKMAPPLHNGCLCRLWTMGEALSRGLLKPGGIPSSGDAERLAAPIVKHYQDEQEEQELAALRELVLREELAELPGADLNLLASMPLKEEAQQQNVTAEALREDAAKQTGAMIALYPDPELAADLALDGGEEPSALHVTLAFLGDAADLGNWEDALEVVRRWAESCPPLKGELSGVGTFAMDPPVTYLSVDLPGLPEQRERLVKELDAAGFPPKRDHGFTPHMTLDYASRRPDLSKPRPVTFREATLSWAGERHVVPFAEALTEEDFNWDPSEHPRDAFGRFVDAITQLAAPYGSSRRDEKILHLDERTSVAKDVDGTVRVTRSGAITRGFQSERDAARYAFDASAKGKDPDSIGGDTSHKGGFDDYLRARGYDPDEPVLPLAPGWTAYRGMNQMVDEELTGLRRRIEVTKEQLDDPEGKDKDAVKRRLASLERRAANYERKLRNAYDHNYKAPEPVKPDPDPTRPSGTNPPRVSLPVPNPRGFFGTRDEETGETEMIAFDAVGRKWKVVHPPEMSGGTIKLVTEGYGRFPAEEREVNPMSIEDELANKINPEIAKEVRPGDVLRISEGTPIAPGDYISGYTGPVVAVDYQNGKVLINGGLKVSSWRDINMLRSRELTVKDAPFAEATDRMADTELILDGPDGSVAEAVRTLREIGVGEVKLQYLIGDEEAEQAAARAAGAVAGERWDLVEDVGRAALAANRRELEEAIAASSDTARDQAVLDAERELRAHDAKNVEDYGGWSAYWKESERLRKNAAMARLAVKHERAKVIAKILKQYRPDVGRGRLKGRKGKSALNPLLEAAVELLPGAWINGEDRPKLRATNGRGSYSRWSNTIKSTRSPSTMIHEMGHFAEARSEALQVAQRALFESRKKPGETPVPLSSILPGHGYRRNEVTIEDEYTHPYVGKVYGDDTFEILTTGLERIFYKDRDYNPAKDKDHIAWTIGALLAL